MYDIKSVSTIHVLYKLLELANFNENKVNITTSIRKDICNSLKISNVTFSKCIKQLTDLHVLTGTKGTYIIDEGCFWKGDYRTRQQLMKSNTKITIEPTGEFDV